MKTTNKIVNLAIGGVSGLEYIVTQNQRIATIIRIFIIFNQLDSLSISISRIF